MDKRFFLALFLSLIVIAISQLLLPPPRPVPNARGAIAKDSSSSPKEAASSTETLITKAPTITASQSKAAAVSSTVAVLGTAETTTVSTPKTIYKFSNIGAAPVSIVMRDYKNRSPSGGLVDLAVAGSPLLGYRLVTPADTADLANIPFSLSRATNTKGEETLTYRARVKNLPVSITYTVPADTTASYAIRVDGHVEGIQGQSYL